MIEILKIVLTQFWPFLAAIFLICALGNAIAAIVASFRGVRVNINRSEK